MVLVGQVPFMAVWFGTGFFPYDAFTIFTPVLSFQTSQLLSGEGIVNLDQEVFPTQVASTYAFGNLLRQLTVLFAPAGPHAHSLIQAMHILLSHLAVAGLIRSFGVPLRYGIVGGLVFVTSGINVSLTQHVASSEAMLYLVTSLLLLRLVVLTTATPGRFKRLLLGSLTTLSLVSLVRGHHEAVIYFLPVTGWTVCHIAWSWKTWEAPARRRIIAEFVVIGVAVLVCSSPMLVATYELSEFNKTLITDVSQLGNLFPDVKSFIVGLLLPHATGALSGGAFALGHDSTLSYTFAGTLTIPLLAACVHDAIRRRELIQAGILVASVLVFAGYAFGPGSIIFRVLARIYPPFVQIGHTFFGLHLLYLVTAFVVAAGLRALTERGTGRSFSIAAAVMIATSLGMLAWAEGPHLPKGFTGDAVAFRESMFADVRFSVVLSVLAVLAVLGFDRLDFTAGVRSSGRAGAQWLGILIIFTAMIAVDMLRPLHNAHFLPSSAHVQWAASEHGGFVPGKRIVEYLANRPNDPPSFRAIRVLPIMARAGGWQANSLLAMGVALVSTPGDSGGNRHLEQQLKIPPTPTRLGWIAEKYGVDYFWIARWGKEEWLRAAEANPSLKLVLSEPWGGDLYHFSPSTLPPDILLTDEGAEMGWFLPEALARREVGMLWTKRNFQVPLDVRNDKTFGATITLPLLWKRFFTAKDATGRPLETSRDELGRLRVALPAGGPTSISVVYPPQPLQVAVAIAAVVYILAAVMALLSGVAIMRRITQHREPGRRLTQHG